MAVRKNPIIDQCKKANRSETAGRKAIGPHPRKGKVAGLHEGAMKVIQRAEAEGATTTAIADRMASDPHLRAIKIGRAHV